MRKKQRNADSKKKILPFRVIMCESLYQVISGCGHPTA